MSKILTRKEWIERCSAQFMLTGGLTVDDAEHEAEIYLDDVLGGDLEEDPVIAAMDAMDDWG